MIEQLGFRYELWNQIQSDSYQGGYDPNNKTMCPTVTEDHLKNVFSQYREIVHVKIPAGKRCRFILFSDN